MEEKLMLVASLALLFLGFGVEGSSENRQNQACANQNCISLCEGACGDNANCDVRQGVLVCTCAPGYTGNPYVDCRIIDPDSSENSQNQACVNQNCISLCEGACGDNANCDVRQGVLVCTCAPGYTGNPYVDCRIIDPEDDDPNGQ